MNWNFRGFGRRTQLKDYLRKEKIDIICLQETIKTEFTDQELRSIEPGETFHWNWVPAVGHSGGLLLGVKDFKDSLFEVGSINSGQFFISALVYHREAKFKFEIIGMYGHADHARSEVFLNELEAKVLISSGP
jgi:exonuclease III